MSEQSAEQAKALLDKLAELVPQDERVSWLVVAQGKELKELVR